MSILPWKNYSREKESSGDIKSLRDLESSVDASTVMELWSGKMKPGLSTQEECMCVSTAEEYIKA